MSIKQNITSLQNLLEQVNTLPEAENLDAELSIQTELISEQDAKIAELANILAGKAGGSGNDPFATVYYFTYTVDAISNAQYGFTKNNNGYYESQNKGKNNSYAICRVNLTVTKTCDIIFDVINYAESNYDYALFGDLNKALSLSNTADSSNVKKNFKGQQSASVVNVTYAGVTAGTHFIDIKFIKDSSQHSNNDSVQFKIQEQSGLSQETINKILAADSDLVAENIKSGVNIFGVNGTLVEGGIEAAALITRTMSEYTNSIVSSIGSYAFYRCSNLTAVSFPVCTSIGSEAFGNCSKLTSVNFPACTSIGGSAFNGCYNLTSVSFPVCTSIGNSAFDTCENLTSVNFSACKTIGSNAFRYCDNLTSVNFPVCTRINTYAFYNCSKLISANFPACTSIGGSAFDTCKNLTSVNFPACTSIDSGAFNGCYNLTSVSFPVCRSIGKYAFYNCYILTFINFPKCTDIGYSAFEKCYKLSQVYLTGSSVCKLSNSLAFSSTPYAGYSTSFSGKPYIYVPQSLLTSYQTATNWTYFSSYFSAVERLDGGNIISFTIDETEYQAEEGMTWGQWVDSDYNTGGYSVDTALNFIVNSVFVVKDYYSNYVSTNDLIMANHTYKKAKEV